MIEGYADYVRMRGEYVLAVSTVLREGVPRPKKRGVIKMIVRGRTCAMRNKGIIHPRNTISSEAGPYKSVLGIIRTYNNVIPPPDERRHRVSHSVCKSSPSFFYP